MHICSLFIYELLTRLYLQTGTWRAAANLICGHSTHVICLATLQARQLTVGNVGAAGGNVAIIRMSCCCVVKGILRIGPV